MPQNYNYFLNLLQSLCQNLHIWIILRPILYNFHSKSVYIMPAAQGRFFKMDPKIIQYMYLVNFESNFVQFPLEECFYYR